MIVSSRTRPAASPAGRRPAGIDATPGSDGIIFPSTLGWVLMTAGYPLFRLLLVVAMRSGEDLFSTRDEREGVAMNDPTSILEQARRRGGAAGKGGVVATTIRRCACVSALILLLLTIGVGSMPSRETGSTGIYAPDLE